MVYVLAPFIIAFALVSWAVYIDVRELWNENIKLRAQKRALERRVSKSESIHTRGL